jgi:hypothetical protein
MQGERSLPFLNSTGRADAPGQSDAPVQSGTLAEPMQKQEASPRVVFDATGSF